MVALLGMGSIFFYAIQDSVQREKDTESRARANSPTPANAADRVFTDAVPPPAGE